MGVIARGSISGSIPSLMKMVIGSGIDQTVQNLRKGKGCLMDDMGERIDKPEVHDNVVWNDDDKEWRVHIRVVHAGGVETVNRTFAPRAAVQADERAREEFDRLDREAEGVRGEDGPPDAVEVHEDLARDVFIVDRWGRGHERFTVGMQLAHDIRRDHFPHANVQEALLMFFDRGLDRAVVAWHGEPPLVEVNPPEGEPVRLVNRADLAPPVLPRNLYHEAAGRRGNGARGFLDEGRRRQAQERREGVQDLMRRHLERIERGALVPEGDELPQVLRHPDAQAADWGIPLPIEEPDLLPDRPFGEEEQIIVDVERAEERAMEEEVFIWEEEARVALRREAELDDPR